MVQSEYTPVVSILDKESEKPRMWILVGNLKTTPP